MENPPPLPRKHKKKRGTKIPNNETRSVSSETKTPVLAPVAGYLSLSYDYNDPE